MDGKELVKAILSRKFAIAIVGIIALCYIAKAQPGQLPINEKSIVSIVPMPKVPAAEQRTEWLTPAFITLIVLWTVGVQGWLDRLKLAKPVTESRYDKYKSGLPDIPRVPPMPAVKEPAEPEDKSGDSN